MEERRCQCCIIGAGPAGLGAALELVRHGVRDVLVVDRNRAVGGLARTVSRDGVRFDVGPHRFYTKNPEIRQLWRDVLGDDLIAVDRLTRIYYHGKFFHYPIKALDVFGKLGPVESLRAFSSFLAVRMRPGPEPETFEDWIVQKFGRKLYEAFFETYTEKVWGIPCDRIGAEWAAQRIKGLDVWEVLRKSLLPGGAGRGREVKTLAERFDYPRYGAGQMYERMAQLFREQGGTLLLDTEVRRFRRRGTRIESLEASTAGRAPFAIRADHYFTSAPLTHFYRLLEPGPEAALRDAVEALFYREHITVDLLVKGAELFPDQWIYVHDPDVRMARLANYNNFSRDMVGVPGMSAISVEYFAFQDDPLWKLEDEELVALAARELGATGLVAPGAVEKGWVVRETESYPTYYLGYQEPYEKLKAGLDAFTNLSPIGRGGLYKYNNQDHSTYSGMLAVRNYLELPGSPYNLWDVNIDAEYLEE